MNTEKEIGITQKTMKTIIAIEMKTEPENGITQAITKDAIAIAMEELIEVK